MPYQNTWLIEDRVIFRKIWGNFTDLEAQNSDQEALTMFEQSSASKIHILIDLSDACVRVSGELVHQLGTPRHPKYGWLVVYGAQSSAARALVFFASQVFNLQYQIVENHHQAVEFLAGMDTMLSHETS